MIRKMGEGVLCLDGEPVAFTTGGTIDVKSGRVEANASKDLVFKPYTIKVQSSVLPKYFYEVVIYGWSEETARLFYKFKSVKRRRSRKKLFKRFLKSFNKDRGAYEN